MSQVDTMLAKYIRAQLALAGLSFVFYTTCMLVLGFLMRSGWALWEALLEFLPAVGWIASATAILTVGFLTHAHWIWMAALLILWRLVQDYVNSPRIMSDSLQLQPLIQLARRERLTQSHSLRIRLSAASKRPGVRAMDQSGTR